MSRISVLLDEHMPSFVGDAMIELEPSVNVVQVGVDPVAPPKGTLDPDVLKYAEANGLALVTFDKNTMIDDMYRHLENGRHTWGMFLFPNGNQLGAGIVADSLIFIWAATEAEEWIDKLEYLPYRAE